MVAHDGLAAEDMAAKVVQAARQYTGITLNVSWEAGLQSQDPLLFSGPLWEPLTGIKINVIPLRRLLRRQPAADRLNWTRQTLSMNWIRSSNDIEGW